MHLEAGYAQGVWPRRSKAHIAGHTARPEAYDRHIAWHITAPSPAEAFVPQPRWGMGIHPNDKAPNIRCDSNSVNIRLLNLARTRLTDHIPIVCE